MIYKYSTTYYRKAFEVSPLLHNADGRLILIQTNLQMQNLVYPRHMSNNPSNNPTALSDFVPCLCRFRPLSFSCKCKSSRFAVMTCPSRRFCIIYIKPWSTKRYISGSTNSGTPTNTEGMKTNQFRRIALSLDLTCNSPKRCYVVRQQNSHFTVHELTRTIHFSLSFFASTDMNKHVLSFLCSELQTTGVSSSNWQQPVRMNGLERKIDSFTVPLNSACVSSRKHRLTEFEFTRWNF